MPVGARRRSWFTRPGVWRGRRGRTSPRGSRSRSVSTLHPVVTLLANVVGPVTALHFARFDAVMSAGGATPASVRLSSCREGGEPCAPAVQRAYGSSTNAEAVDVGDSPGRATVHAHEAERREGVPGRRALRDLPGGDGQMRCRGLLRSRGAWRGVCRARAVITKESTRTSSAANS